MLQPGDRRVLLEALRPPPGYVVDRSLATTYSLDLIALLVAPLAFSLYDTLARQQGSGVGDSDALGATALLHAVRAHAERLTVFCQAGSIARPGRYRQLLVYLEDSVVEVCAPSASGVFHPKVWVQRFTSNDGPVRYRLLVNSRNLTFDRSWDTMLVLDGELRERTNAISVNRPLADFLSTLPSLSVRPPIQRVADDVALIADEVKRVAFEVPDGFDQDELRFWPLGHDGKSRWPFDTRSDRMLVVSPFVRASTLDRLASLGAENVLVSRPEEVSRMPPATLRRFREVLTLNEAAEPETDEPEEPSREEDPDGAAAANGLHAKLYVADAGWNAHIWTGSANATEAAFLHNVEFLVELVGKKSKVGIDALLGDPNSAGACLRALLLAFSPPDRPAPSDAIQDALDERIRTLRRAISRASWKARVLKHADSSDGEERYRIELRAQGAWIKLAPTDEVRCWPISLPQEYAAVPTFSLGSAAADFARCSFQALTSFFAFEIQLHDRDRRVSATFVVNALMEGAPDKRQARLLLAMLDDPAKVMRFLRMLLATDPLDGLNELLGGDGSPEGASPGWRASAHETPLLEALLQALDRDPFKLVEFDRTLRELRSTPEGSALLPPDLARVWEPVRRAWESLPRSRGGRA